MKTIQLILAGTLILQSVSASLGANLKISESFFLSATSEIEFKGVLIVPLEYMAYGCSVGAFMKF